MGKAKNPYLACRYRYLSFRVIGKDKNPYLPVQSATLSMEQLLIISGPLGELLDEHVTTLSVVEAIECIL